MTKILSESEIMRNIMTRVNENSQDIKVYGLQIYGGRAGDDLQKFSFVLPGNLNAEDEDSIYDWFEDNLLNITPNDGNWESLLRNLRSGKEQIYWDSFGEGIIGLTTDKTDFKGLKSRLYDIWNDEYEDDDWDEDDDDYY